MIMPRDGFDWDKVPHEVLWQVPRFPFSYGPVESQCVLVAVQSDSTLGESRMYVNVSEALHLRKGIELHYLGSDLFRTRREALEHMLQTAKAMAKEGDRQTESVAKALEAETP